MLLKSKSGSKFNQNKSKFQPTFHDIFKIIFAVTFPYSSGVMRLPRFHFLSFSPHTFCTIKLGHVGGQRNSQTTILTSQTFLQDKIFAMVGGEFQNQIIILIVDWRSF